MEKSMREIFLEKVAKYPKLDLSVIKNISDLEEKGEGTFIIDDLPSVDLMKEFPKVFNSSGEVSLFCIENIWFITLSKNGFAYVPTLLDGYIKNGVSKCFLHSHPGEKPCIHWPSFDDLEAIDSIDRKIYIISYLGITEIDIEHAENLDYINERWENFLLDEKVSLTEYQNNPDETMTRFLYHLGCKVRLISFDQKEEIYNLLKSKENLKNDFWDIRKEIVPYPGKKK